MESFLRSFSPYTIQQQPVTAKDIKIDLFNQSVDGSMICNFTSFSTDVQSYQDDERVKMKSCVQWNHVYG